MASPIAHSVSGYILGNILLLEQIKVPKHKKLRLHIYAIFVSIFADFDFIPQIITGERFHRGLTHSIFFTFIFSVIVSFLFSQYPHKPYKQIFLFTLIIYAFHLLLDFFTAGGEGIQLLSPFTNTLFKSPIYIFPKVDHSSGLWAVSHIITISFEFTYSVLMLLGLSFWQRLRNLRRTKS